MPLARRLRLKSQPNLTSDSLGGKILLAVLSAALGAIATVTASHITAKEPRLMLTITAPRNTFGQNKVVQFITVKNIGEDVAKGVRLNLTGCEGRLYDNELAVQFSPPRPGVIQAVYGNDGSCVLDIGNLQPDSHSIVRLSYRNPVFQEKDIKTFSDNAKVKKVDVASPELLQ